MQACLSMPTHTCKLRLSPTAPAATAVATAIARASASAFASAANQCCPNQSQAIASALATAVDKQIATATASGGCVCLTCRSSLPALPAVPARRPALPPLTRLPGALLVSPSLPACSGGGRLRQRRRQRLRFQ